MKIGEVAARTQTPASTIRYYERIGVLPEPERESGQRVYEGDVIEHLEAISVAQNLGFRLEEIKMLLGTFHAAKDPSAECRRMAEVKIQELDEMVAKAHKMKQILEHGLDCQCTSLSGCYVSESQ